MEKFNPTKRDPLTAKIIQACYQVHNELGPGFVERIYAEALKLALINLNLAFDQEKEYSVKFGDKNVGKFRVDLVVDNTVIVEIKAVEPKMPKLFEYQVLSYLKASGLKVGLFVNFGSEQCQIRRLMIS